MTHKERVKYKNDWQKKHTDRINLTIPKGQKENIRCHASAHHEHINSFIKRAINDAIEQDKVLEQTREKISAVAKAYRVDMVNIDDQELKKLAVAFAALKPQIPNIEEIYFSQRQQEQQPKKFQVPPIKELGGRKDQNA